MQSLAYVSTKIISTLAKAFCSNVKFFYMNEILAKVPPQNFVIFGKVVRNFEFPRNDRFRRNAYFHFCPWSTEGKNAAKTGSCL